MKTKPDELAKNMMNDYYNRELDLGVKDNIALIEADGYLDGWIESAAYHHLKVLKLIQTLRFIAHEDYRGNRPESARLAEMALKEYEND